MEELGWNKVENSISEELLDTSVEVVENNQWSGNWESNLVPDLFTRDFEEEFVGCEEFAGISGYKFCLPLQSKPLPSTLSVQLNKPELNKQLADKQEIEIN